MKNKTSAIIRIVCFSLLALVLTSILIAGIKGDGFNINMNFGFFSSNQYDNADKYTAGNTSISPVDGLKELNVTWMDGEVKVIPYEGEQIAISETADSTLPDEYRVHTYYQNGTLNIQYRKSGSWHLGFSSQSYHKKLEVKIPQNLCNSIKEINGDFVSANSIFTDITTKSLTLDNVSGDVTFTGSLEDIEFDTVSGDIDISSIAAPKQLEADSVSGDVTLRIPADSQIEIEYDSVSGDIHNELMNLTGTMDKHSGSLINGNGNEGDYEFDSVSGNFNILELK